MNTDFDKIYLTHKEVFLLFKMRFNPRTPQESLGESFKTFREYDFIRFNFAEGESEHSCKKYDGTVHLSDTYYRYCITKCHLLTIIQCHVLLQVCNPVLMIVNHA